MKTTSTVTEGLMLAVLLAPFIYLGLIWQQLPAEILTHYDLQGHPDGWHRKETTALGLGGTALLLYGLLRFLPQIDPKGRLQTANYQKLRFVLTGFFAAVTGWLWYAAGHPAVNPVGPNGLLVLVSLMLAGVGNYLTTLKPNWFVGIRTPWTLGSETVWRRTHQLAGRLLVAGGLLSAVLALVVPMPYTMAVVLGIMLLVALVPVVYSYVYFRREKFHSLR